MDLVAPGPYGILFRRTGTTPQGACCLLQRQLNLASIQERPLVRLACRPPFIAVVSCLIGVLAAQATIKNRLPCWRNGSSKPVLPHGFHHFGRFPKLRNVRTWVGLLNDRHKLDVRRSDQISQGYQSTGH